MQTKLCGLVPQQIQFDDNKTTTTLEEIDKLIEAITLFSVEQYSLLTKQRAFTTELKIFTGMHTVQYRPIT